MDTLDYFTYVIETQIDPVKQNLWRHNNFAEYIIENNDIPDNCMYCLFSLTVIACRCQLVDAELKVDLKPFCTVYDFTKWLLEHI